MCHICLAMFAFSTPVCEFNEFDDISDIDERAPSEAQGTGDEAAVTPNVYIERISAYGTGCPTHGSAQATIAPSKQRFLVAFTDMRLLNAFASCVWCYAKNDMSD